jgi:hypothetical protein
LPELPLAASDFQGQKHPCALPALVISEFKNSTISSALVPQNLKNPSPDSAVYKGLQKNLKIFHKMD